MFYCSFFVPETFHPKAVISPTKHSRDLVSGPWEAAPKGVVAETCDDEMECSSFHVDTDMQC
jgi:hypothetical protein